MDRQVEPEHLMPDALFGPVDPTVSAASSVSDILCLIATHHADILSPTVLRELGRANILFIRGDVGAALRVVNAVLAELDSAQPAYGDVVAFRLFLTALIGRPRVRPAAGSGSGAAQVVSLCVESDVLWNSGHLFRGLSLNQSAIQHGHGVAAVWRLYADVLLAKKLSDIHVGQQASRLIRRTQDFTDGFGFHAFGAVPEALRSVLHLQSGQYGEAIRAAGTAVRIGEQRATVVGVKLALSVSAMAHLGLGEQEEAIALLKSFHAQPPQLALADSIARTAFAELALLATREGPKAAADQARARWPALATGSGCFIEDPTRPAWLVTVGRLAGDAALAERSLRAIQRLAGNNPGVALLEEAAGLALTAFDGGRAPLSAPLELAVLSVGHLVRPHPGAPGGPVVPTDAGAGPGATGGVGPVGATLGAVGATLGAIGATLGAVGAPGEKPKRLPRLSRREDEIARLVGRGLTNQQVATQLGLSPHTVNFHLRNIFRKLSISTRVSLGRIIAHHDGQPDRFMPIAVPAGPPDPPPDADHPSAAPGPASAW
jgi:DNA-binding CsgD family transcriptional regulator